jgi:hypothetical protein
VWALGILAGCGGGSPGNSFVPSPTTPPVQQPTVTITSQSVPSASVGTSYSFEFAASGGIRPYRWQFSQSPDPLPAGLGFDPAAGVLSGTPETVASAGFQLTVTDSSTPVQSASRNFRLLVNIDPALVNRNDTVATATPLAPGEYLLSISPYDASQGSVPYDQDYFLLTAVPGTVFTISAEARNAKGDSTFTIRDGRSLDAVIQIVDANGRRLTTCKDPLDDNAAGLPVAQDPTPSDFDDACMNDGLGVTATLDFQVPGTGTQEVPFYVHVFDWRGHARPDLRYNLSIVKK